MNGHRSSRHCDAQASALAMALASALVWCGSASTALACGGGFGKRIDIRADQSLAIGFRDGMQTYVFAPRFCGAPEDFGIVLPIAGPLQGKPVLGNRALFPQLDLVTAPKTIVTEVCSDDSKGSKGRGPTSLGGGDGNGTDVISSGMVGIFDWVELSATDASELTDWLDDNEFSYDSTSEAVFAKYVEQGFRFVAFKVSPDAGATPQLDGGLGDDLCGTFGPIELRFATDKPVVPMRIAVAHSDASWHTFTWDVFIAADKQMRAESTDLDAKLRFSGPIDAATLEGARALESFARKGERLTLLRVEFHGDLKDDLWLVPSAKTADFRTEVHVDDYVDCDGCSVAGNDTARMASDWLLALAVALVMRSRRKRSA